MKPTKWIEHPEGGRFCEVYRSESKVLRSSREERCALTHIYFSLEADEVSHFHRVASDEVWNLYSGEALHLYLWDGSASAARRVTLSTRSNERCHVVPAGTWQAAVPVNGPVLVGCTVAPGFEFTDFAMLSAQSDAARLLRAHDPRAGDLVKP